MLPYHPLRSLSPLDQEISEAFQNHVDRMEGGESERLRDMAKLRERAFKEEAQKLSLEMDAIHARKMIEGQKGKSEKPDNMVKDNIDDATKVLIEIKIHH